MEITNGDFWVLLAMLIYFIVVLTIGFVYAKRSNSSTSEYFIGGRKRSEEHTSELQSPS